MRPPILQLADFPRWAERLRQPWHDRYYAMYSSVFGGIVTDPRLMLLPMDDHLVHRGDGIFEAFKIVDGAIYNFQAHLDRLRDSARGLSLAMKWTDAELTEIVRDTVRAGGRRDATARIYVSRGPGSFSVSPYDGPGPQLYVLATATGTPFMLAHPAGARVRTSAVPPKDAALAITKTCNYVPNVLMKKEALDAGVDFTVGFDARACLTEGAVENFGIVTRDRRLLFPKLDSILPGTTMLRIMELARSLLADGELREVGHADLPRAAVEQAAELLVAGTTIHLTAAVEFDNHPIGDGRPGPLYRRLSALFEQDLTGNAALRTPVD